MLRCCRLALAGLITLLFLLEVAWAQQGRNLPGGAGQQPSATITTGQEPLSPEFSNTINKKDALKAKVTKGSATSLKSPSDTLHPSHEKYGASNYQRMDSNLGYSSGGLIGNTYSQSGNLGSKLFLNGHLLTNAVNNPLNTKKDMNLDGNLLRDALRHDDPQKARKKIKAKDSLPPTPKDSF
jgi:hypothetical protein